MVLYREFSFGSVTDARDDDVPLLAPKLRAEDVEEIAKFSGLDAEAALSASLANSKIALALRDKAGAPVTLLGIGWAAFPRAGLAWMLSSREIEKVGLVFLEIGRNSLGNLMQGHDVISNYVHEKNTVSLRWLRWLGFEKLSETTTPHSDGDKFFEMARFADPATRALYLDRDWTGYAKASGIAYALG